MPEQTKDGCPELCRRTRCGARIDLFSLSLVIHADLPNDAQVLQHRSGRTGRAGKKGVSVLLVPPSRRRRAEEMLGRARVTASWGNAPSADDIRKVDHDRLLQNPLLVEPGSEDDLAMADELLKLRSPRELAAAFVKMYRAGLPGEDDDENSVMAKSTAAVRTLPANRASTNRTRRRANRRRATTARASRAQGRITRRNASMPPPMSAAQPRVRWRTASGFA